MKIPFQKPIEVYMNNIGAIFLIINRNTSERSRHSNVRFHYIRDLMDEGLIKISLMKSEQNEADIFTKILEKKRSTNIKKIK